MAFFNKLFAGKNSGTKSSSPVAATPDAKPGAQRAPVFTCDTWLVVKAQTKEAVIAALDMQDVIPCTWEEGSMYSSGTTSQLFVTDFINGYCLVTGKSLPDLAYRVKALSWLADLSESLPEVYGFAAQDRVQVYAFIQANSGEIVRGYAVAQGSVRVNRGQPSEAEIKLGYSFPVDDDQLFEPEGLTLPSTEIICALSEAWGLSPVQATGTKGFLGKIQKI